MRLPTAALGSGRWIVGEFGKMSAPFPLRAMI